jgi:peptide deformylase
MPVRPILELGDPRLRQPAQPVPDPLAPEVQALIDDLRETLAVVRARRGWGDALAAPVVGAAQRVIMLERAGRELVLINPRFEAWGRTQLAAYERCLTFDAIWGAVYRPDRVVVVAVDAQGAEQRLEASGSFARLLQHEMDHLDGLVWLDRDPDLTSLCTAGEYARRYAAPPEAS